MDALPPPSTAPASSVDLSHLTGCDKAAVLLMYLDDSVSRRIFARFSEREIRKIGGSISAMDNVDPDVVQAVIAEFAGDLSRSLYLQAQGNRYLESVFPSVLGADRAQRMLRSIEPLTRRGFQERFGRMQPGSLAARLRREHPQTIAVACAVLGAEVAGGIIGNFERDLQVDVVLRMARLERFPLELLADIEDLLGAPDSGDDLHTAEADGSKLVADVIGSFKGEEKEELLAALSEKDEGIAGEVSRQMFSFGMLSSADDKGIQNLLKEVERKELALALKGADGPTRAKFFGNMSSRAAQFLQDDMEAMGPVRLSEVEEAQQQIVSNSLQLEEEGKLIFLGQGEAVVE